jgi:hypothetical protein
MTLSTLSAGDVVADGFTLSGGGVFADLGITIRASQLALQKGQARGATCGGRRDGFRADSSCRQQARQPHRPSCNNVTYGTV